MTDPSTNVSASLYEVAAKIYDATAEMYDSMASSTAASAVRDPFKDHQPQWCPPSVCFVAREFPTNPCSVFEFYLCSVVIGALCLVGMVLNTLSIVIFSKDKHNSVPTFLFKALAFADNAVLLISLLVLSTMLGPFQVPAARAQLRFVLPFLKKYLNPLGYIAQACTIWLTVALSVHRYIAICHPFVCKKVMTLNRVRIEVAVIVLVSVTANVPRFFQYEIYWEQDKTDNVLIPRKRLTPLGDSQAFDTFYTHVFYTLIILILPLLFLIFFNVFICHQLNSTRKKMRSTISAADAAFNSKQDRGINIVMIIIVAQLLICHSPDRIVIALKFLESQFQIQTLCLDTLFYWSHIANLLIIINSATDFFIYITFRPRFRLILARCCLRGASRKRYRRVSGRTSSITSQMRPSIVMEGTSRPYFRDESIRPEPRPISDLNVVITSDGTINDDESSHQLSWVSQSTVKFPSAREVAQTMVGVEVTGEEANCCAADRDFLSRNEKNVSSLNDKRNSFDDKTSNINS